MIDLLVLAYQTDLTRVSTFMLSREASTRTYSHIGVPDPHHAISHHGNAPDKIARVEKINAYHVSLFSYFLDTLQATPDGDGTLLDHSLLMYGGGIGNGNLHQHQDLPCLLVGGTSHACAAPARVPRPYCGAVASCLSREAAENR